jgi:hypothetical protein
VKKLTVFCILALGLGLSIRPFPGFAQSSSGTGTGTAAQGSSGGPSPSLGFDSSEFPLWAKDLRRAEIVAFGSFPFTMFFTTFAVDTWRCYSHGWDPLYAPWPAKPPGAINMSQDELTMTIAVAAVISAAVAVTDFSIVQIKRYREKQRVKNLPAGSPIRITRKPAAESESAAEPESDSEPVVEAARPGAVSPSRP